MAQRLTRKKDNYPCRIKNCYIEDWVLEHIVKGELIGNLCNDCPIEPLVNKLAEYEDREEEHHE